MWPTLFHIPNTLWGLPVFGPGLLVGLWALVGAGWLAWHLRQGGWRREMADYAIFWGMVAAMLGLVLPRMCDAEGLPIRGYGVMMLCGLLAAVGLAVYRGRSIGIDADAILSGTLWLFIPGLVGARLLYVIRYWDQFSAIATNKGMAAFAVSLVNMTEGGLVVFGGFFGVLLGFVFFVRAWKLPVLPLADLAAPSLALALAFGRVGCVLYGCCFGGLSHECWAVTFPSGSPVYGTQVVRGQFLGFSVGSDPQAEARIAWVIPDSTADEAGLKAGDRIASIGGYQVANSGDVQALLQRHFTDEQAVVLVTAEGKRAELGMIPAAPRSLPVHPVQLYSSMDGLLLCLFLLAYAPLRRRDGELFALMITVYPVVRFLEEMIRTDEPPVLGTGLTISKNVSLLMLLGAGFFWAYVLRQPRGFLSRRPANTGTQSTAPLQ